MGDYDHNYVPDEELGVCLFCGRTEDEHRAAKAVSRPRALGRGPAGAAAAWDEDPKAKKRVEKSTRREQQDKGGPGGDETLRTFGVEQGKASSKLTKTMMPRAIVEFGLQTVRQVSCGKGHTILLTDTALVYTWGAGSYGQLGHGDKRNLPTPKLLGFFRNTLPKECVVEVAAGSEHSGALNASGQLFLWGRGDYGQLGMGEKNHLDSPSLVRDSLVGRKVFQFCLGWHHSVAVSDDGEVFTWGQGYYGALGHGKPEDTNRPTRVDALIGLVAAEAYAGGDMTIVTAGLDSRVSAQRGRSSKYQKHEKLLKDAANFGDDESVAKERKSKKRSKKKSLTATSSVVSASEVLSSATPSGSSASASGSASKSSSRSSRRSRSSKSSSSVTISTTLSALTEEDKSSQLTDDSSWMPSSTSSGLSRMKMRTVVKKREFLSISDEEKSDAEVSSSSEGNSWGSEFEDLPKNVRKEEYKAMVKLARERRQQMQLLNKYEDDPKRGKKDFLAMFTPERWQAAVGMSAFQFQELVNQYLDTKNLRKKLKRELKGIEVQLEQTSLERREIEEEARRVEDLLMTTRGDSEEALILAKADKEVLISALESLENQIVSARREKLEELQIATSTEANLVDQMRQIEVQYSVSLLDLDDTTIKNLKTSNEHLKRNVISLQEQLNDARKATIHMGHRPDIIRFDASKVQENEDLMDTSDGFPPLAAQAISQAFRAIRNASIEKLSPSLPTFEFSDLVETSSITVDEAVESLSEEVKQFEGNKAVALACQLIGEVAALRKQVNDYSNALMERVTQKMERFKTDYVINTRLRGYKKAYAQLLAYTEESLDAAGDRTKKLKGRLAAPVKANLKKEELEVRRKKEQLLKEKKAMQKQNQDELQ